MFLIYYC